LVFSGIRKKQRNQDENRYGGVLKTFKITLAILLFVSACSIYLPNTTTASGGFVERIVVLDEISGFSKSEIEANTYLSQMQLLTKLEQMMRQGSVIDYQQFWIQNMVHVVVKSDCIDELYDTPGVVQIIPNITIYKTDDTKTASSTSLGMDSWNLEMIGANEIWDEGNIGEGATIGVLDSGCDPTHPELTGKIEAFAYIDSYGRKGYQDVATDTDGHGTSVCSVVAGETTGVAPGAKLVVGAVIPGGSGSLSQILGGMQWILDPDGNSVTDDYPRVVNMSFGAPGALTYLESGINNLKRMGILPVASAGNEGEGSTSNPGNFPDVLAVGSVDFTGSVSSFSGGADVTWEYEDETEIVTKPDLCAPGEGIRVATPHRTYDIVDGTSFAAPHVAGLCALLLSANPGISAEDLKRTLIDTSAELGKPGKDRRYGHGLIDCVDALHNTSSREARSVSISWPSDSTLWGDIEIETSDTTYTLSRSIAHHFTFLSVPGDTAVVKSFGFVDKVIDDYSVELEPLPTFGVDITATSAGLGGNVDCKVRFYDSPLQTIRGSDGHVSVSLPEGTHPMRVYSFGHSIYETTIDVSADIDINVELTLAELAFIDDRQSIFGIPPEPIQGRIKPALESSNLPYFIWTTRDGRVTASQLLRFPYVIWNLGGSPSEKIIKVLKGYMDRGGKLILTSSFFGASYLGESDSTVFLESYFGCAPNDEGGAAIKHWDGQNFKSLSIDTDTFLQSSSLVPISDEVIPIFDYAGFESKSVAGLRVSNISHQGIILGFTIPEISGVDDRKWLINKLISSFDKTRQWSATVKSGDTALDGVATILGEQVEFSSGELFVPHTPTDTFKVGISSYGYKGQDIEVGPNAASQEINLVKSATGTLDIKTNTNGYIIFHNVPVSPMEAVQNSSLSLPEGDYDITFASNGFIPQRLNVRVPGSLETKLIQTSPHILLPKGASPMMPGILSNLGMAAIEKESVKAEDIVSSDVFLISSGAKIKRDDRLLIAEIKKALLCGARVVIAHPEMVKEFGNPIEIESIATNSYASVGKGKLSGMLVSTRKASDRYGTTIPVISGGETLLSYLGNGTAIALYDNLVASTFDFEMVDLESVRFELIRVLLSEVGEKLGRLQSAKITGPKSPTNSNPVEITGFAPPASSATLTLDEKTFSLNLDPEGFFTHTAELGDGTHTIQITCSKDGQVSKTDGISLVVDTTPPIVDVVSPRDGRISSSTVEVIARVGGAKTVKLDGVDVSVVSNLLVKQMPTTSGVLVLEATDVAGNITKEIISYTPDPTFAADSTSSKSYNEIAQIGAAGVLDSSYQKFNSAANLTKGEVAIWVARATGLEEEPGKCPYPDVAKTHKAEGYIGALFEAGALSGNGNFNPDAASTKEFLLQVIANLHKLNLKPKTPTFSDLPGDNVFFAGIEGCVGAKLIDPADARLFPGKLFRPGSSVTREQGAIVIYNLLKYIARVGRKR